MALGPNLNCVGRALLPATAVRSKKDNWNFSSQSGKDQSNEFLLRSWLEFAGKSARATPASPQRRVDRRQQRRPREWLLQQGNAALQTLL